MAEVTIAVVLTDGTQIQVRARGGSSYPDALAQLRAETVASLKAACLELGVAVAVTE